MADSVATQVLADGPRNYIAKFTSISDGTGESAVTKITVANLSKNPDGRTPNDLVLQKIEGFAAGMGVDILWDATTPLIALAVPPGAFITMEFDKVGGIWNNAGTGKTGNVKFSTRPSSSVTTGSTYSLILHFTKCYPN